MVKKLEKDLAEGKKVAVHCRQGIGRSALIAAGVLIAFGDDPDRALERISTARGLAVPETAEQAKWVRTMAPAIKLNSLGQASFSEIEKIMQEREVIEPETGLSPEVVKRLQERIANQKMQLNRS